MSSRPLSRESVQFLPCRASLYERPVNLETAKAAHAEFRRNARGWRQGADSEGRDGVRRWGPQCAHRLLAASAVVPRGGRKEGFLRSWAAA
jgi:hypothetical protein